MNRDVFLELESRETALWEKLKKLLALVSIDEGNGDLVLHNGKARLILKRDGVVRIEGEKITGFAEDEITLNGAFIDLN